MLIKTPPKHAASSVVSYIKGKSAIAIARQFGAKQRNFNGERFGTRVYAVSTVKFEEARIKEYIWNQGQLEMQGLYEIGNFLILSEL